MRKFFAVVRQAVLDAFQYRLDLFLYVLGSMARPVILLTVWLGVLASSSRVPLARQEIIQYYLALIVVLMFTSAWAAPFIARDIRLGNISNLLLKPVSFFHYQLGNNIAEKLLKSLYLLPVIFILGIILHQGLGITNWFVLPTFIFSLVIAMVLNLLLNISVGITSFWTSESGSLDDFLDLIIFLFSGKIFPLSLLPKTVQDIATVLPFRYTVSFPIEILLGKLNSEQTLIGFTFQLFWLASFILIYRLLWSKGIKKYSAVGA